MQLKLQKHVGFIMEAVVEAFPQSLIQMVAIVYYQEADAVAIVSILTSMLSVSSKSLIFSRSVDPLTFVWNWLCSVTDFFVESTLAQAQLTASAHCTGHLLRHLLGV